MNPSQQDWRAEFESTISALHSQMTAAGAHLEVDSRARALYSAQIRRMADELRQQAASGKISWAEAARQAQETRNIVMGLIRGRSTPVGVSLASRLKASGASLDELIARQSARMYGNGVKFAGLSVPRQNAVYAKIVESAGKSNPAVSAMMKKASYAGRGLIFLSLAIAVYNVSQARDKVGEAGRQALLAGAGVAGSVASGALAGLACGPGAPICVTVGAFVGGALAAFGVSMWW